MFMCNHGGDQTLYYLDKDLDLQILSVFLIDFLSDGDPVYSSENLFENVGTPVKSCLKCSGTAVKTCLTFWQSLVFSVRSPPSVVPIQKIFLYINQQIHILHALVLNIRLERMLTLLLHMYALMFSSFCTFTYIYTYIYSSESTFFRCAPLIYP